VVERLYEKELMYSPLVREPLTRRDMDDFADAFEKVASNIAELRAYGGQQPAAAEVYDAVAAINARARGE